MRQASGPRLPEGFISVGLVFRNNWAALNTNPRRTDGFDAEHSAASGNRRERVCDVVLDVEYGLGNRVPDARRSKARRWRS